MTPERKKIPANKGKTQVEMTVISDSISISDQGIPTIIDSKAEKTVPFDSGN